MNEYKEKLEEYGRLMGASDPESEKRKDELVAWLEANHTPEVQPLCDEWAEERMKEMEADVEDIKREALRQQMSEKAYKLIPWSYIAKEYFGKSVSWLTQRINGYPVRGRVYTLNTEQKDTLNRALSDIGDFIGSYRLA